MGSEDAILYSSSYCTISSAIPAFARRGDVIICDQGVSHSIHTGIVLSRATVHYFKHNDMADLERILIATMPKTPKKLVRKFLAVEGLYYNYGDICPIREILALKEKYKFRIFLDESHSIGALGPTGRGVTELQKVNAHDVELITGSLGNAFGAGGGFCVGDKTAIYHQRLSGSGYVFSASLPPFLSACAETAIDILDANPALVSTLSARAAQFHALWRASQGEKYLVIKSVRESPIVHLYLQPAVASGDRDGDEDILEAIATHTLENGGVFVARAKYLDEETFVPPASIRVCLNAAMTEQDVETVVRALRNAVVAVCGKL